MMLACGDIWFSTREKDLRKKKMHQDTKADLTWKSVSKENCTKRQAR
jgi:hypothetical protein